MSTLALYFTSGLCVPVIIEQIGKSESPLTNAVYNGLPSVIAILAAPRAKKIIRTYGHRTALVAGSVLVLVALLLFALCYYSPVGLFAVRFLASGGAIMLGVGGDIVINQHGENARNIAQPLVLIMSQVGAFSGTFLLNERFVVLKELRLSYPVAPFLMSAIVFFLFSTLAIRLFWQNEN